MNMHVLTIKLRQLHKSTGFLFNTANLV